MIALRPYQTQMVQAVLDAYAQGVRRVCAVAPCGAGKTVMVGWMIAKAQLQGVRTLFIVHRKELLAQADRTFQAMGIHHGVIASGVPMDASQSVQIGSTQTVAKRLEQLLDVQFIVIDGAHHATAATWRKIMARYPEASVLGVTATPARLGGSGLGDVFDTLIMGPSVQQLIEWGNLAPYRYFAPPSKANMGAVHSRMGDYVKSELEQAVNDADIIGDIVENYRKLADGKQACCYCVTRKHSEHVAALFREAGIPAQHVDGDTDKSLRNAIIERFRRREIKVLCNVDLFGEGFDVPGMEAVILARPTQSLTLYIQQAMRAMRPDPDNPHKVAVIIDHAGNCFRHGLPDEDREWTLDVKPKRKRAVTTVSITMCEKCYQVYESHLRVCPYCGYAKPAAARELKQADGDLQEIARIKRERRMEIGRAKTKKELESIAIARGYKLGWVSKIAHVKGIKG